MRNLKLSLVFIAFLGFLLICILPNQTKASPFTNIHVVASSGDFGTQSSLALDSEGNPYITYTFLNATCHSLMIAKYDGSNFILQTIDVGGGENPSIDLDSNDSPHVSYSFSNETGSYLMYASLEGSEWKIQKVQFVTSGEISDSSLKLDENNLPHIVYLDADHYLEYATWTGSAWNIEAVDVTNEIETPSFALDPTGRPCISYYDPMVGLKCAMWTGSTWSVMIVDSSTDVGRESSLCLDSRGKPHISYDDDTRGNLKYASWTGSKWEIQTVDYNKRASFHSSLALDSRGNPHISYQDNAKGNLVCASWTGEKWYFQVVDPLHTAGEYGVLSFPTSIALDASDTAHISYSGYTRHDLKYATISEYPSFLVTFDESGAEDFEGNLLRVDSLDFKASDLPKLFVWQAGSNHTFTFVSEPGLSSGSPLTWISTSGLSNSRSDLLTVSKEGIVIANYGFNSEKHSGDDFLSGIPLNYLIGSVAAAIGLSAALLVLFMRKKNTKKTEFSKGERLT